MSHNPFSLDGKTVLVTGASSGIGRQTSIECSKMGASLVITGRNRERLQETVKQTVTDCVVVDGDVRDSRFVQFLAESVPQLDGIVFNAGIAITMPVKNITEAAVNEMFDVNIISPILSVKHLLKSKKVKPGGSIIFISSISTSAVKIGNGMYSATKGAVNSFSKVLALELAPRKIRANCVQPGFIRTDILRSGLITEDQLDEHEKLYPLGFGKPSDIAYACVYLLSDASTWITGSILTVDGGFTLR